jgi:DNA-binding Lrp family transcriptional regulator
MSDTEKDLEEAAALMGWSDPGPKESLVTVSGYTPAPDALSKKFGYVTSVVWGRMWRYCQQRDGVCRAKIETIAKELNMSDRTIIRHIHKLVSSGYFEDTTPDLKNRPHIYRDTGKLRLAFSTEIIESGVTESQSRVTESQSEGDRESHEDSIKRGKKKILASHEISEIVKQANEQVDAILKFAGLSAGKSWTKLPEIYHAYGKVFCAGTGLTYAKSDLYKWMSVFDTWEAKGHTPGYVLEAINELKSEGKAGQISGPSSITWKLEAMAVARNARKEKAESQTEHKTVPSTWLKFYGEDNATPTA